MEFAKSAQRITVLFLALLLCGSGVLYGQERAGTSASPQLLVPLGSQYIDGSGAAAGISGIESVLWNPAGLDKRDGDVMVMGTRREHLADVSVNFISLGVGFDDIGTFAVHIRNFDVGEIEETTASNPGGTGSTFEPTFFTFGLSYGISMSDQIRVGITSNVTNESFADVSGTGVTFDAGVQYDRFLGFNGLNLGVSIRNIGSALTYSGSGLQVPARSTGAERPSTQFETIAADAEIPTTVDLSLEYNVWRGLNVAATYSENTFEPVEAKGQISYNFRDLLTVRGQWSQILEDQGELESPYENRPSFGGTLNLESAIGVPLSFDYAFVSTQFFDNNHLLTLRGTF
jgi:hypothetical protein